MAICARFLIQKLQKTFQNDMKVCYAMLNKQRHWESLYEI